MYCRACGVHADDEANFCISCGADLRGHGDEGDDTTGELRRDLTGDLAADPVGDRTGELPTPVVREPPTDRPPALVPCARCGAPNTPRRSLCGRCGSDLESGRTTAPGRPLVLTAGASARADTERSDRRLRWAVGSIVAVGLVVGALVGVGFSLELGPFADAPAAVAPPAVAFDPAAYPGEPQPLAVESIATSTVHPSTSDARYEPDLLVDGELATAWNNAGQQNPDGVGEVIDIEFAAPAWLSEVVVANGDQADTEGFLANARAKRVRVATDTGEPVIVNLLDEPGRQAVRLPVPRLTTGVRFEVLEVYPGDTYEDLAISELGFRGFVANDDDASLVEVSARRTG